MEREGKGRYFRVKRNVNYNGRLGGSKENDLRRSRRGMEKQKAVGGSGGCSAPGNTAAGLALVLKSLHLQGHCAAAEAWCAEEGVVHVAMIAEAADSRSVERFTAAIEQAGPALSHVQRGALRARRPGRRSAEAAARGSLSSVCAGRLGLATYSSYVRVSFCHGF